MELSCTSAEHSAFESFRLQAFLFSEVHHHQPSLNAMCDVSTCELVEMHASHVQCVRIESRVVNTFLVLILALILARCIANVS